MARPSGPHLQPYGISVTGAVTEMRVRGCNLNDNGTGPLYVPYTLAPDLQVTGCAGYNDRNAVVHSGCQVSGASFNGTTFGYYGPVMFYLSPQTSTIHSVSLNGSATGIRKARSLAAMRTDRDASVRRSLPYKQEICGGHSCATNTTSRPYLMRSTALHCAEARALRLATLKDHA
jgi:hypothetical protein